LTGVSEDGAAFARFLETSRPAMAEVAMALRQAVLMQCPGAIEWFDPGNGLLAVGMRRSMRDLLFAVIPHSAHVNLQLVDGIDLPNPDGRIEGTGKRARHVKARSLADVDSPWMRAAITAQLAWRADPRGT